MIKGKVVLVPFPFDDFSSTYSPDLPGCAATGATLEEVKQNMHEAIELHVRGLLEDNLPIPESTSSAEYITVQ